ncbi:hypothetical protein N9123_01160 [Pseudomonadales bacterium]|nr:hypothetical protein [Pseudomonadales bacterium]
MATPEELNEKELLAQAFSQFGSSDAQPGTPDPSIEAQPKTAKERKADAEAFAAEESLPEAIPLPTADTPVAPVQPIPGSRELLIQQQQAAKANLLKQQELAEKQSKSITNRPRTKFLKEDQSFAEAFSEPSEAQRAFAFNAGLALLSSSGTNNLSQRIGQALGSGMQGMQSARQAELDGIQKANESEMKLLQMKQQGIGLDMGFTKDIAAMDSAAAKAQADAVEKKAALEVAAQKTAFSQMSEAGKAQQQIKNAIDNKDYSLAAQIQKDYEKSTGVTGNKVTQAYDSIKGIRAENAQLTKLGTPEALAQIELNNSQIADQRRLAAGSGGQVIEIRDRETGEVTFSMGSGGAKTALNQRKLEVGLMDKQWMSDLIGSVDAEQDIVDTIGEVIFSPNYKDVSGNIEGTVLETPLLGPLYNQIIQTAPTRLLYRKANELSTRLALPQTRFFKPLSNTEWPIVRDAFKIPLSLDQDQVQDLFVTTRIPLILATTASAYNRRNPEMGTTAGTAASLEFASETMVSYIQKGLPLQAQDMETFGEEGYLNNNADYALKTWFPSADPALKNQGYILGQNNKLYTKDVVNAYVEAYKERSGVRDYNAEQFMKDNGMEMY